jgi:glycosyltransferase involved in cell wall biosynthesis
VSDRFYQIAPIVRSHDAVGRMSLALDELFRRWGKKSLVFTERQRSFVFGPLRKGLLDPAAPWAGLPSPEVSLYQHSIGSHAADVFLSWPARKKILIYQNITPGAQRDREWGREQLSALIRGSDIHVAPSEFSAEELRASGARSVLKLPYLSWNRAMRPGPANRPGPRLLVVARVVPHKGVKEAVLTLSALRERQPKASLFVVGPLKGDPAYVAEVKQTIRKLGLEAHVHLCGRVSDRKLVEHYRKASALLSLSDHEGFCVPVVEAMRARTPVVALGAGAVPETLGRGGLLLDTRDPRRAAEAIEQILKDEALRARLLAAQAEEERRFSTEAFAGPLREALGLG